MRPLKIGITGVGKIAREQHIPAIRGNSAFELAACANSPTPVEGVANFPSIEAMLDGSPGLDAIAICSPPQAHYEAARIALERRKHVLLEKPPCATTTQLDDLVQLARLGDCTLFQTWHGCHAAAVDTTQRLFAERTVRSARVVWKEDVRQCHLGQKWLWEAGGFGVLDAGINALSILTKVVPEPVFVRSAKLYFPTNCETPVAAEAALVTMSGGNIQVEFDFRHKGSPVWDMQFETDRGAVCLSAYGNMLTADGSQVAIEQGDGEYPSLYRRFAELTREGKSEVDKRPFWLTADIFLVGKRLTVEPFEAGD